MNTIIIGSDHGGFELKKQIAKYLDEKGYKTLDLGCHTSESCDYPIIAKAVAKEVLSKPRVIISLFAEYDLPELSKPQKAITLRILSSPSHNK